MYRCALFTSLVLVLLLLSACGSDAKDDSPQLESRPTRSNTAPTDATPTPADTPPDSPLAALPSTAPLRTDAITLPAIDGLRGSLYVIGGDDRSGVVAKATFDGQPADILLPNINNSSGVLLAPDGQRFGITGSRSEAPRNAAWMIDAGGIQTVVGLGAAGIVTGWSPDSQQMVVATQQENLLVGIDGTTTPLPTFFTLAAVAWTTEGEILFGLHDFRSGALMQVLRNAEPEPEVIISAPDPEQAWASMLDVPLEDYTLAAGYRFFNQAQVFADNRAVQIPTPPDRSATGLCDTWTAFYGPQGAIEPVLALDDTHWLASGPQLPDGSLVVIRYFKPTCSISENVMVEAWQVTPDGSSSVIVEAFAIGATTIQGFFATPPVYALAPDGRYALWVGSVNDTTALVIKDLQADVERVLTVTPGIQGVVWVGD